MVALAPIIRAWLRYHTDPRHPGPLPACVGEERKRPSRAPHRRRDGSKGPLPLKRCIPMLDRAFSCPVTAKLTVMVRVAYSTTRNYSKLVAGECLTARRPKAASK